MNILAKQTSVRVLNKTLCLVAGLVLGLASSLLSSEAFAQEQTVNYPINQCWKTDAALATQFSAPAQICVEAVEVFVNDQEIGVRLKGNPFNGKLPVVPIAGKIEGELTFSIPLQDIEYGATSGTGQCLMRGHTEVLLMIDVDDQLKLKPNGVNIRSRADYMANPCKQIQWQTTFLDYKLQTK